MKGDRKLYPSVARRLATLHSIFKKSYTQFDVFTSSRLQIYVQPLPDGFKKTPLENGIGIEKENGKKSFYSKYKTL